jgi:hypothetical protein
MEQTHPALWFGIGAHLRRNGHQSITKFDVVAASKEQFDSLGGLVATPAADARITERSHFLVSLVADAEQTNSALFPDHGEGNAAAQGKCNGTSQSASGTLITFSSSSWRSYTSVFNIVGCVYSWRATATALYWET